MYTEMNSKNQTFRLTGIHLLSRKHHPISQAVFYILLLTLGIASMIGCYYSAFPTPVSIFPVVFFGILFIVFFTFTFSMKKYSFIPIFASISLWGILLFFLRAYLIAGFKHSMNFFFSKLSAIMDFQFFRFEVEPFFVGETQVTCTVFAVFALFVLVLLFSWLLIREKSYLLSIIASLPFLACSVAFSIVPHYTAIIALLSFWGVLLCTSSALHRESQMQRVGKSIQCSGSGGARIRTLLFIPLLGLLLSCILTLIPESDFARSKTVEHMRTTFLSGNFPSVFQMGGIGGNTNSVDLNGAGDISFTGKTALRIKSTRAAEEYLKSFVGSYYSDGRWEPLPLDAANELASLQDTYRVQEYPELLSNLFPTNRESTRESFTLSIENINANPRSVFTPYYFIPNKTAQSEMSYVHDGFIKAANPILGLTKYQFELYPSYIHASNIFASSFPMRLLLSLFQKNQPLYNEAAFSEEQSNELNRLSDMVIEGMKPPPNTDYIVNTYDRWSLTNDLRELLEPKQIEVAETVSAYTDFIYEHYTQLPDSLKPKLQEYLKEHEIVIGPDAVDKGQTNLDLATQIKNLFLLNYQYTLTPGELPADKDPILYFLNENKKGYCMHFASSAVALLRSAGIPARYSEGYRTAVQYTDVDNWVNIPDSQAHAWVEIYIGSLGWFPFEVTPVSIGGTPDNIRLTEADVAPIPPVDLTSQDSSSSQSSATSEASSASGTEQDVDPKNPEADSTGKSSKSTSALVFLLPIILAILISAALFINRKIQLHFLMRKLTQTDTNARTLALYTHIQKLLNAFSPVLGNIKMFKKVTAVAEKAKFSQHRITEKEMKPMLEYQLQIETKVKAKAAPYLKFYYKYIRVLF